MRIMHVILFVDGDHSLFWAYPLFFLLHTHLFIFVCYKYIAQGGQCMWIRSGGEREIIQEHSKELSSSCCCSSSSPTQSRWVSWLLSVVYFFFFFAFIVMIWLILKLCYWVCILVIWLCLSLEMFERKIVYCYDL